MISDEEYRQAIKDIKEKAKQEELEIAKVYAMQRCKFKVGDILVSKHQSIKVTKIKLSPWNCLPEAYGFGYVLTKKLVIRKDKTTSSIFPSQIVEIIKGDDND